MLSVMRLVIEFILYQKFYCFCCISEKDGIVSVEVHKVKENFNESEQIYSIQDEHVEEFADGPKFLKKYLRKQQYFCAVTSALYLKKFLEEITNSTNYKVLLLHHIPKLLEKISQERNISNVYYVRIKFIYPKKDIIDYKWNWHILNQAFYSRESEHLSSWLSTLGGGFSCVGDNNPSCAKSALRISRWQMTIGNWTGDNALILRAKLWGNFSMAQLAASITDSKLRCERATLIKKNIWKIHRKSVKLRDRQLQQMCLGILTRIDYLISTDKNLVH